MGKGRRPLHPGEGWAFAIRLLLGTVFSPDGVQSLDTGADEVAPRRWEAGRAC